MHLSGRDSTAGNFRTALSGNGSRLSVFPERDVDRNHSVSPAHRIAIRIKGDPAISLESVRTSDRSVVSELNLSVRIGTDKSGPIIDIRGLEFISVAADIFINSALLLLVNHAPLRVIGVLHKIVGGIRRRSADGMSGGRLDLGLGKSEHKIFHKRHLDHRSVSQDQCDLGGGLISLDTIKEGDSVLSGNPGPGLSSVNRDAGSILNIRLTQRSPGSETRKLRVCPIVDRGLGSVRKDNLIAGCILKRGYT